MTGIDPVMIGMEPVPGSRRLARCRPRVRWAPKTRPVAPAATMTITAAVVTGSIAESPGSVPGRGCRSPVAGTMSSASSGVSRCGPTPGMRPTAPAEPTASACPVSLAAGVAAKSRMSRSAMPAGDAGRPVSIRTKRAFVGVSSRTVGPPLGRSCTSPVWIHSRPSGESSMT
jgi:hypothetical protein